jgi:hypothetical protein
MPAYGEEGDRVYHGVRGDKTTRSARRLLVEVPADGPTARQSVTVLGELREPDDGGFGWGHDGIGTSRAAAAILADALDLGSDIDRAGISVAASYPKDTVLVGLREEFCSDVLSQCCDEFRLHRRAVLRWARGWYAQRGITDLPAVVADTPIDFAR